MEQWVNAVQEPDEPFAWHSLFDPYYLDSAGVVFSGGGAPEIAQVGFYAPEDQRDDDAPTDIVTVAVIQLPQVVGGDQPLVEYIAEEACPSDSDACQRINDRVIFGSWDASWDSDGGYPASCFVTAFIGDQFIFAGTDADKMIWLFQSAKTAKSPRLGGDAE